MKLEGKVALVTGASSGFGKATALLFGAEGAKVVVVFHQNAEGAKETVELISQSGGEASSVQADVSVAADCEKMIRFTERTYGKLDILDNNAGIAISSYSVKEKPEDAWDQVMAVNVKSVYLCSRAAMPLMRKQGGGSIINNGSVSAVRVRPGGGFHAYPVSKAAIIHLTKCLALEAAPFRIRVNCISAVTAETPLLMSLLSEEAKANMEETRKAFISTIPMGRMAVPEDIAKAALFLASDDSFMVTGLNMLVDGGRAI